MLMPGTRREARGVPVRIISAATDGHANEKEMRDDHDDDCTNEDFKKDPSFQTDLIFVITEKSRAPFVLRTTLAQPGLKNRVYHFLF